MRLGDKPREFIGSRQWIGAIELSYILDEYLGVVSKIITVNRCVFQNREYIDSRENSRVECVKRAESEPATSSNALHAWAWTCI